MNPTLREYLVSSFITFVATFLLVLGASVQDLDPTTLNSGTFSYAAVSGMLLAALRAAIKVAFETLVRKAISL